MIKVITSFVSCLAAILLGVLALATDFWRVSWREAKEISGVQFNHEGLFHTCHETSINNTVVAADSCTDLHGEGRPGIHSLKKMLFFTRKRFMFYVSLCVNDSTYN